MLTRLLATTLALMFVLPALATAGLRDEIYQALGPVNTTDSNAPLFFNGVSLYLNEPGAGIYIEPHATDGQCWSIAEGADDGVKSVEICVRDHGLLNSHTIFLNHDGRLHVDVETPLVTRAYGAAEGTAVRWSNTTGIGYMHGDDVRLTGFNSVTFSAAGTYRIEIPMAFTFSGGAATDCVGMQAWQPATGGGANDYVGPQVDRDNDTATMTATEVTEPYYYEHTAGAGTTLEFYTKLCAQGGSTYPSSTAITEDADSLTMKIWRVW